MSSPIAWDAVSQHAKTWAGTPVFARFAAQLPDRERTKKTALPLLLSELDSGGGRIVGQPLRIHKVLHMIVPAMGIDEKRLDAQFDSWSRDAARVWEAHRDTIAWIRSRLPGYPKFFAPQLTSGTTFTTDQFSYDLTWAVGERSRGLGAEAAPPRTATSLEAEGSQRVDLERTANAVATALCSSEEWLRLRDVTARLDDAAHAQLRAARSSLLERLAPERIDAHEPQLALRRDSFRRAVLAEEIAKLSGVAGEYTEAFERAQGLIVEACSDVFGQLAVYGAPSVIHDHQNMEFDPGPPPGVSFSFSGEHIFHGGELVRIVDPLVPEVLRIVSMTISYNRGDLSQRVDTNVLVGSAALPTS